MFNRTTYYMDNFCQFWNSINGEPYTDGVPPPVKYEFKNLVNGPINGTENGTYELRPINQEDMMRYASDDVTDNYLNMHDGKNPLALSGKEMTDGEFKKFYGQTW